MGRSRKSGLLDNCLASANKIEPTIWYRRLLTFVYQVLEDRLHLLYKTYPTGKNLGQMFYTYSDFSSWRVSILRPSVGP